MPAGAFLGLITLSPSALSTNPAGTGFISKPERRQANDVRPSDKNGNTPATDGRTIPAMAPEFASMVLVNCVYFSRNCYHRAR